ncbi:alpha/beta hydrolase [Cytobacillus sp. FSL M8-0252]|uniref:alpha/beta hydrolase n=1 Tax=Cytobacillus sp. FSL M8-0252 TaxID=2921621 RepID=UPI0030F51E5D
MNTVLIEDIEYGNVNGKPLLLDIIRPTRLPEEPMPVIIYIHGGGWSSGDKAGIGGREWNSYFAKNGYFVVNINYRLSGEAIFPAQIHDCKAAVRWLRANHVKYHIHPEKIGVWGHSAGGHLAALLATSIGSDVSEGKSGHPNYPTHINCAVTVSAPIDILNMGGWHDLENSHEAKLIGEITVRKNIELAQKTNPIQYINDQSENIPFLIIHGEADKVVPFSQAQLIYENLPNAALLSVKGADHGMEGGILTITTLLDMILSFFDQSLFNRNL